MRIGTESACPYCDVILDAATAVRGKARPKPADLTVCVYCAQICVFDDDLQLRRPLPGELKAAYAAAPGLQRMMQRAINIIKKLDRRDLNPHEARRN